MHLSVLTICLKYYNLVAIISDETVYCQVQKEKISRFPRGITDLQKIHPLALEKILLDFLTIV